MWGVFIVSDLQLQFLDPLLHPDHILLQSSLLVFQSGELLLQSLPLCVLISVVSSDLFLHSVQLIGQSLPRILALHSQNAFQSLFLASQYLHLLLVSVQLLL